MNAPISQKKGQVITPEANEISRSNKTPLEEDMRRINATFGNPHLIHFDIAVHILFRPSGVPFAFNRPPLMNNLLGRFAGCQACSPGAPPVQASASERSAGPGAQERVSLEPDKPSNERLSGGQSHFYKIALSSGQYLRITVSQQGIDALLTLFTPDNKKIGEVDSEKGIVGRRLYRRSREAPGAYMGSRYVPLRRRPKWDAVRSR